MQDFRTSVILLVLVIFVKCQDEIPSLSFNDGIDRRTFYSQNLTIDYESCEQMFYDDEDYKEEGCHRTQLPDVTIEDKFGAGVSPCCGLHGYMASGSCSGHTKEVSMEDESHVSLLLLFLSCISTKPHLHELSHFSLVLLQI